MIIKLQKYALKMKYRSRKELCIADMLSRVPVNRESRELQKEDLERGFVCFTHLRHLFISLEFEFSGTTVLFVQCLGQ